MCKLTPVDGSSFSEHPWHGALHHRHMRALTRHAIDLPSPLKLHHSYPETQRRLSMLPKPFYRFAIPYAALCAQNGSFLSSTDPRLPAPEETLFRNVRKPGSPISIPRAFNTPTQARSAARTILVRIMFASCSFRSQSISSHETSYSEVSNAHLCRKLAQSDWLILEAIAPGMAVNAILTGMRAKERG